MAPCHLSEAEVCFKRGGRTWSVRMRMTSMTAKLAARAIVATVAVHTLHLLLLVRECQYSSERLD
jgi:hypothetical protein